MKMKEWIDNVIRYEGAKTISESLKINTSLTTLNLGREIWKGKERRNEMKE